MKHALRSLLALYVVLLVGPVPAAAGLPAWSGFVGVATVGVAVSLLATRDLDDPERLLSLPRILLGFALPLPWLAVAVQTATSVETFLFGPYFWGALAALVWMVAVAVASTWRTRRRIDELTELVVFEARRPPAARRQLKIVAGAAVVLSAVAFAVPVIGFGEVGTVYWVLPAQIPVWVAVLAGDDGREVALADDGVRIEGQFHEWEQFDGYELTDEALSLSRPAWYRGSLSFDRSDVDDLDAVTAALDRRFGRE